VPVNTDTVNRECRSWGSVTEPLCQVSIQVIGVVFFGVFHVTMSIPVRTDNGKTEVFQGYWVHHSTV